MLKRWLSLALAGLIFQVATFSVPAVVNAQANDETEHIVRTRARVITLGVATRVSVKLRDNRRLVGYISRIGDDNFVVSDSRTGTNNTIAYTDVTEVKRKDARRLSTATTILIILGIVGFIGGLLNSS